ncbi:MAG TPA: alpha-glucan family phosphorylase [Bacteroidales bacterium]|jgi:phosphorylase/glycogen(starch) synthase|nr:MAG: Glycogen phosphorylase [Bacteroidetes bacterium ADurb.Bin012]HNQ59542.1 alpha-glucan family phosphorylase [Bacteroidales bacterium]HNU21970.1 alpha-glucan family phosphorylase [Bacteroidales bacterium]HNV16720.1 alpha-glucan family phosphorylase [Bacteroidales bacterium]HNZ79968.1 alpha-glucan family phosphorylase [Bacteroidales bacterium]
MAANEIIKPDYLFEVSWEVCNKIGGIFTVLATKAGTIKKELDDNYIVIGPDVWMETHTNPYFEEDHLLYRAWRMQATSEGLKVRLGRFKGKKGAVAILVDFTSLFPQKDKILAHLWEKFGLDSITGGWDYIEPLLFGYAAGKVIESFYEYEVFPQEKVVAHCHEWMSGGTILYLKENLPQIATVFTTHATVLGRSISGHNWPLYRNLEFYNPETIARELGVVAKYSLEKTAALNTDILATVSNISAAEARKFFGRDVDYITPNGFDVSLIPDSDFETQRIEARKILIHTARTLLGQDIRDDAFMVVTSGRYEFRNKGLDAFIDALGYLDKNYRGDRQIIAWLMVPFTNKGPNPVLKNRLEEKEPIVPTENEFLTHNLYEPEQDQILSAIKKNQLTNSAKSRIKVIFVPAYLDNQDGIFNKSYYDLLLGCDLSVFPSYYEPWGYTPLESIAYHVPTVTTSLAGFGQWVLQNYDSPNDMVRVLTRNEDNYEEFCEAIAATIKEYSQKSDEELHQIGVRANAMARDFVWENMIDQYWIAYSAAIEKAMARSDLFRPRMAVGHPVAIAEKAEASWRKIMVDPGVPPRLEGLVRLSKNLWWSWNNNAIELFSMIDKQLWEDCEQNPIALIESLPLDALKKLENDTEFLTKLDTIVAQFDQYMAQAVNKDPKVVAYFSMEYGIHDSLKIYSGGLGILAGDYLKEASDCNKNIIAIGLLYRYGYFQQEISIHGDQIAKSSPQKFSHMPLIPVRDADGNWIKVSIAFPGRTMYAKAWLVEVGRIPLYLLDTEIDENLEIDRSVTHFLYGGDWENRLKQELLLGVGGIRLLHELNIRPHVYHLNEGHAAFIGIERLRDLVQNEKLTFNQAIEIVRSTSLFTTHTPVPAGHDTFTEDLLRAYIPHYADRLTISWEEFIRLGRINPNDTQENFSVSVLAINLCQEVNGVSRIHETVTQKMFVKMFEGYFPEELHIGHVTNGVHFPTWASIDWQRIYAHTFGKDYILNQSNPKYWEKIYEVSDENIWAERMHQKEELIKFVKKHVNDDMTRRQENPKLIFRVLESIKVEPLTIGFARRFAYYKRAYLLFFNMERLAKIVNNPRYPVQFIFAGKAHPADQQGQDLIKKIYTVSKQPEFLGKIIFLENYGMEMAKSLIRGVDVWLNTPMRLMEASGTSGEKAVMNGVVNFSVQDGWWADGYKPGAGWAIKEKPTYTNDQFQDELDAETIYSTLEEEIIPTYYDTDWNGVSSRWVAHVKNTIANIAPHFTMKRQLDDYYKKFYTKLFDRGELMKQNDFELAKNISAWKRRVTRLWKDILVLNMKFPGSEHPALRQGETFHAEVTLDIGELSPEDIGLELIFGRKINGTVDKLLFKNEMNQEIIDYHIVKFFCHIPITKAGVYDFSFRLYPKHPLLPHRQDFCLVRYF